MSLRWPNWASLDMSELCARGLPGCYDTKGSEDRKLFGSISEAPTFGEEPTPGEMLRSSLGLFLAAAVGVFARNRPCFDWKWKTTDGWDPSAVMLCGTWICFNRGGRFEHRVFHVFSTNKSETKAKIAWRLVPIYVSVCVTHLRYFRCLRRLLLTSICQGTLFK